MVFLEKTLIMAIFLAMTGLGVMANMMIIIIMTVMKYYELASNMVYMGVLCFGVATKHLGLEM